MNSDTFERPPIRDRLVTVFIGAEAPDADWLARAGVVAVGGKGVWRLTATTEGPLDWFDGRLEPPAPIKLM